MASPYDRTLEEEINVPMHNSRDGARARRVARPGHPGDHRGPGDRRRPCRVQSARADHRPPGVRRTRRLPRSPRCNGSNPVTAKTFLAGWRDEVLSRMQAAALSPEQMTVLAEELALLAHSAAACQHVTSELALSS